MEGTIMSEYNEGRYRYDPEESGSPRTGDRDFSEPAEPRRKKGKGGCFLRLLFTLLLVLVAAGVGFAAGRFSIDRAAKGLGLDNVAITKKLEMIESYVSDYYLNEVDDKKVENNIYKGFMKGLEDPYADYYSQEEYKQLNEEDSGEYYGIGVTVMKDPNSSYVLAESVFKDMPAYKAGMENGDLIMEVDGQNTAEMTLQEFVSKVKSRDSEKTVLKVFRDGEEIELTVIKSDVIIDTVDYEMKKGKIGYISVSQFIDNTDEQFMEAMDDLTGQGMKSLIIDLRDNGGGLVTTCVNMVSRIIPEGKMIFYMQDKQGNKTDYNSNSSQTYDGRIILLVNGNSASASEIMTGCLKDYKLATVVGEKTYGKGIVQNIMPLSDGSAIKFTVAAYYTPSGANIHEKGIEPDVKVEMTRDEVKEALKDPSKDKQLKKALELLK